jgi:hypothetical protein
MFTCPEYAFTAVAPGKALAAFSGFRFGSCTYYFDGGSAGGHSGASWFLMMNMLREAYERALDGKFVMGYFDYATYAEEVGGGLVRSRRSCRVTDYPTSIGDFTWSATPAGITAGAFETADESMSAWVLDLPLAAGFVNQGLTCLISST